jgi:hypothetical protein
MSWVLKNHMRKTTMKKSTLLFFAIILLSLLTACEGTSTPDPLRDEDKIATIVAATLSAIPTNFPPTPTFEFTPTAKIIEEIPSFKHEQIVYGIKKVTYSMSAYEANKQNIPPYKYVNQHTEIFRYSIEQKNTNLLFSDEALPVFILNTLGGGDSAIHDIVAAAPRSGKLYARMMPKDQYTSYDMAGSLYELSIDGKNNYRKIFDFEDAVSFVISPDEMMIAYISNNFLFIHELDSGNEINRIDLGEYQYTWISPISWAPDSKTILFCRSATSATPNEFYDKVGCYLVNIYENTVNKLDNQIFQNATDLSIGFKTDPFGYSYYPNSNRLVGIALKYEDGHASPSVKLFSVDLEGLVLNEIPLEHSENVWNIKISPSEKYVSYQCLESICVTDIQDGFSEIISYPITVADGVVQQQTVIGWLEN